MKNIFIALLLAFTAFDAAFAEVRLLPGETRFVYNENVVCLQSSDLYKPADCMIGIEAAISGFNSCVSSVSRPVEKWNCGYYLADFQSKHKECVEITASKCMDACRTVIYESGDESRCVLKCRYP